jgi:hypothetical protein
MYVFLNMASVHSDQFRRSLNPLVSDGILEKSDQNMIGTQRNELQRSLISDKIVGMISMILR